MNALIISDLHAHAWTRFATTLPDGTNSRFKHLLDVLDQVSKYILDYRPQSLIILGDVTHRRYFVNFSVYNKLMAKLVNLEGKVPSSAYMLVGNHDYESVGVHSLDPYRYAGWTVIDKPTWTEFGYMVPWMPGDEVPKAVENPVPDDGSFESDNIFLHYALDGTPLDSEFSLPSTLKLENVLRNFGNIVLGHVHSPMRSHPEQGGLVTYVGAPLHFDFGDVGDRFCWLIDEDSHLEPLKLEAPKFITTKYPKVPASGRSVDFLRVLGVPRDRMLDVKEKAVKLGWADCVTVEAEVPTEAVAALTAGVMLDADVMKSYVERKYPDLSEEDRADIMQYGLDCLSGDRHDRNL